jgi:hypothetical protein
MSTSVNPSFRKFIEIPTDAQQAPGSMASDFQDTRQRRRTEKRGWDTRSERQPIRRALQSNPTWYDLSQKQTRGKAGQLAIGVRTATPAAAICAIARLILPADPP